jgi:tetratricopeptide (TPR) repeat protein
LHISYSVILKRQVASSKAIALKPDHADAYNNLGMSLLKLGYNAEGINAFKKAISYDPDLINAYNNLGSAYISMGLYTEAIVVLNEALRCKPDSAEAGHHLGMAKSRLEGAKGK